MAKMTRLFSLITVNLALNTFQLLTRLLAMRAPLPLIIVLHAGIFHASMQGVSAANLAEKPLAGKQAAVTMQVPPGFTVDLVASEPDVRQPVALCIDDRGRLWVAENQSYPKHTNKAANDRILIFEDKDGDGLHEKRTVFYERLNYVSGLEVGFGGVWVMSPPFFYFIPDKNGDDVPDAEPQLLLDGFGNFANSHNIANGFAWGPDGWLYGTHGRTNWSLPGKPGTPKEQRTRLDGGVWRYHPIRHIWENYADGCTNPWGIDWDEYGEAFIPNTINPHLFHVIQGAHYEPYRNRASSRYAYQRIATVADHLHYLGGRNVRAGIGTEAELNLGGGHSHCGILIYKGDNWPERYRGSVFLHNTHGRRINNDTLHRKGSGYTAKHRRDLLISKDPWFMGVNFRTGPDGSVFVTDWSDTGECHSTRNTRKHTGRIFRIRYGQPKPWNGNLAKLDNLSLAQLHLHQNEWFTRHARRLIQERAANGDDLLQANKKLREIFHSDLETPIKLRSFWTLYLSGDLEESFLVKQLNHPQENIRAWAIKLLCENPPSGKALRKFEQLAKKDRSLLVRLHLASALQRISPENRWTLAENLIKNAEDVDDPNLPLMYWYGIEPLINTNLTRFVGLAGKTEIPLLRQFITRRVAEQ